MGMSRWNRYSRAVTGTKRWKALRLEALRRDGFQCVQCGARSGLEVDHIRPVRTHPEQAFELENLQTLCRADHSRKTRLECGHPPLPPQRREWRELLKRKIDHVDQRKDCAPAE